MDKGTDRQSNMITLSNFQMKLPALNARELLQGAMADFNLPGIEAIVRRLRSEIC